MKKPKLLIHQLGRHGDIIICLPIARWYSLAYDVEWLCPEEYHINFRNIDYCKPVALGSSNGYNRIIDISFGIIEGPVHRWWLETRAQWQSFIIPKYILAGIPLIERWNLTWKRDDKREDELYQRIVSEYGRDYILCHDESWDGSRIIMDFENKVSFRPIDDFNVFDWYKVILKAKEIHCIDSVLCNFVEAVPEFLKIKKTYYLSNKTPNQYDTTLLINNWRILK